MSNPVLRTNLPELKLVNRGKVRDVYDLGADGLLFVASDRISAFDSILPTGIPDKGRVLTALSLFWFDFTKDIIPNHFISADLKKIGHDVLKHQDQLAGRSMQVARCEILPIECVVRGYLAGSGWKEYQKSGTVCGVKLPAGLKSGSKLPEPIFTPSTKATSGHDENISFERTVEIIGRERAEGIRAASLSVYRAAADYALKRGVIIADTKFEFGIREGRLTLADEVLTPDSSRFWPAAGHTPGGEQPSFDKQFVRDYLETCGWSKEPPAPPLPDEVVAKTREKYLEAYRLLTGRKELPAV
ncbi:MAG TPA: phosphoribosylaminoimidazolesuccinocarboxamide synthase [Planctomycetota bacterium]|nr:phosphoribosylaminoimidazolesuccinocarboxamide synthase [Planctomycetota bacterium]